MRRKAGTCTVASKHSSKHSTKWNKDDYAT